MYKGAEGRARRLERWAGDWLGHTGQASSALGSSRLREQDWGGMVVTVG